MATSSNIHIDGNDEQFILKMKIKASLFTGKSTVHLSNKSEGVSEVHPYDFYVGLWMGGKNEKMEYQMLKGQADGTGCASVSVPIALRDSDHLKMGLYVYDPDSKIVRHIVSGHKPLQDIATVIDGVSHTDDSRRSILLKDNYSKNQALIHLANDGTDMEKFRKLCTRLSPSVLHYNDLINQKVIEMSFGLHNWIEKASCVSNMNGGPNFVNSMCFLESMGCAINYPLLDMTYSSERHRAPLSMLAYNSLATLRYVNMSADEVMALPPNRFVEGYIVPLCKGFTRCPKSMVYTGDKTLDLAGNLDMGTEDFAMVMSSHMFSNLKGTYKPCPKIQAVRDMTDSELRDTLQRLQAGAMSESSDSHVLICDDCETLSGLIKSFEGGIYENYLKALELSGDGDAAGKYAEMLWEGTRDMDNLKSIPRSEFEGVGKLLARYGEMRRNRDEGKAPCAQMGVSIVSAKGASFAMGKTDLNGHACVIAQTLDESGSESYTIAEGTANMTMRGLPRECPERVGLMLKTGEKSFGVFEALNCITQNLADALKTGSGDMRLEQSIPGEFHGKDPYKTCPFYMAGFFVGLEMGSCTPGVIPLQAQNAGVMGGDQLSTEISACDPGEDLMDKVLKETERRGVKGGAPVFGAPIADLSGANVNALPIDLEKVMGKDLALNFLNQVKERNNEVYPPRASEAKLKMLMSRWLELEPVTNYKGYMPRRSDAVLLSCSEGFKCADTARAAVEYKRRIARKFNSLQAEDVKSDGVTMDVHGYMMSAVAQFSVPLPTIGEKWELSCARNLRKAVELVPVSQGMGSVFGAAGKGCDLGHLFLI